MKMVAFKPALSADAWVKNAKPTDREARPSVPMKRFTIDVPVELHSRVKIACARNGRQMADVLRELLEREFPAA